MNSMEQQLYGHLRFEQQLLEELVRLARKQQTALVNYNVTELEEITAFQDELIKNVRNAEEKRINLITAWFGISRKDAANLRLSSLEQYIKNEDISYDIKNMRENMNDLLEQLQNLNITNNLLINRANAGIKEIVTAITGGKSVCNATV
ncbi:MAG: flagellar protein FlgN [Ignavibacteria bacterium]|jgi:hypothetical protein|nr:flagellar protein FlgN [Ignavibacteria bacterium]